MRCSREVIYGFTSIKCHYFYGVPDPYGIKAMIFKHCFDLFWIFPSFSPKSIVYQFATRDVGFRGNFHDISLWILRAKRQKWRGFSRIRANFAGFLLHTSGSFLFKISTTVSKCMNYQLSNKNKKKLNI